MKMTSLFKDGASLGITPVQLDAKADVADLKPGIMVQVSGTSKGHGFTGVVKRHNFRGGPMTHGQKNRLRAPGSIGSTAPQRVVKGRKMAGRYGMERITYKNLMLAAVDADKKILMINGSVPGTVGRAVEIQVVSSK